MTQWRTTPKATGVMRRWLMASGSLSARLAATGSVFAVQVLQQGRTALSSDEAQALGLGQRRVGYAREVLLRVDGRAVVFARSVTAHGDAVGAWRSVRGLGTRPLADVLFKRSGIARQPLAYRLLRRHAPLQRHVMKSWAAGAKSLGVDAAVPARRSVFVRRGAALLVMEVFVAQANGAPVSKPICLNPSFWKDVS